MHFSVRAVFDKTTNLKIWCSVKYGYISFLEKLSFHIACVRILGSIKFGKNINDSFKANVLKKSEVKESLCWKFSAKTGIEIQV